MQEAVAATAATPRIADIHRQLAALYRDFAARPDGHDPASGDES